MKFNTRFSDNYLILLYVSFTLFYMLENVRNFKMTARGCIAVPPMI